MKFSALTPLCLAGLIATGSAMASSLDAMSTFSGDDICYPLSHDTASIAAREGMCPANDGDFLTSIGGFEDLISSLDLSVPVWDESAAGLDLMHDDTSRSTAIPMDPTWTPEEVDDSLDIADDVFPSTIEDVGMVETGESFRG